MSRRYVASDVICPFYMGEEGEQIFCEGLVPNSNIINALRSGTAMGKYKEEFCCQVHGWGKCPIAEMLNKKYE